MIASSVRLHQRRRTGRCSPRWAARRRTASGRRPRRRAAAVTSPLTSHSVRNTASSTAVYRREPVPRQTRVAADEHGPAPLVCAGAGRPPLRAVARASPRAGARPRVPTKDACVEACPVDAITSEDTVPPDWRDYIERSAACYSTTQGQRRRSPRSERCARRASGVQSRRGCIAGPIESSKGVHDDGTHR